MRRLFWTIVAVSWAAGCAEVERPAVTGLDIAPCDVGIEGVSADCGKMQVYENRKTKTGRVIPINFIRLHATGDAPAPYAVFLLAGGPGENATASVSHAISSPDMIAGRDLIVVDQRGTGGSNPLDCVKFDLEARPEAFAEMFEKSFFDAERFHECKDRLSEIADLTQYTTSIIADDIDDLREALGYEQMTLFGGSYGTTLALEIIRRHEDHVRAAILAGAIPPSVNQTETLARDTEDMLEALFVACETDTACAAAYPDFRRDFNDVLARVREKPIEVTLLHTLTHEPTVVHVRYEELVTAIRYALYSTKISAGLPLAVTEAEAGDYGKLTQLLPQILYGLSDLVSEGMWASVRCAEEFPFLDQKVAREISEGTMLGTARLDSGEAICAFWPHGKAAKNFHDPVTAATPVLILAGSVDPATPPWMGEEAARHLPNGRLIVIPNRSHWGLGGDPCIDGLIEAFADSASAADLDASCVDDYQRPPFTMPEK